MHEMCRNETVHYCLILSIGGRILMLPNTRVIGDERARHLDGVVMGSSGIDGTS